MTDVQIAIIGAGFSGLGAAIKLKQNNFNDFLILDRGNDFGGTWRDNTYPGAACDVPSHLYSYSFELNPSWSRSFSPQPEIHAYINKVATKHNIAANTRFNTEVRKSQWDNIIQRWVIETNTGTITAEYLISANGPLVEPNLPNLPGIDKFPGEIFHSARWNHNYSLAGKRVAIIGTGASAIQLVPKVAEIADQLYIYQRTPAWVLPRLDRKYTKLETLAFTHIPGYQAASRAGIYLSREFISVGLTHFPLALSPLRLVGKANARSAIKDPDVRAKVIPQWKVGCKRILMSNTYYPAINQKNVELIAHGATEIDGNAVISAGGERREVDAIVIATGFHVTDSPAFKSIIGPKNESLAETWERGGMAAYKGSTVAGFPNLFILVGPATGLGHTSIVHMIESQLNYLIGLLKAKRNNNLETISVKTEVQNQFNHRLQHRLRRSVWVTGGCASWYKDKFGNITSLWPGTTLRFRAITRKFDLDAYTTTKATTKAENPVHSTTISSH